MPEADLKPADLEGIVKEKSSLEDKATGSNILSTTEDIYYGVIIGANWPTTLVYECKNIVDYQKPMTLPNMVGCSGGWGACEALDKKYSLDKGSGLISVRDASKAVYISYKISRVLWLPVLPIRLLRGVVGSIYQRIRKETFLNKSTILNQDEKKLKKVEEERPDALEVAAQENEKRKTA